VGGALDDLGVGLAKPGADRVEPRGGVGHEDVDHGGQELGVPGDALEQRLLVDQAPIRPEYRRPRAELEAPPARAGVSGPRPGVVGAEAPDVPFGIAGGVFAAAVGCVLQLADDLGAGALARA
jgi:hypothetical protein